MHWFRPPRCPLPDCSAHVRGARFRWSRKGWYRRRCDRRRVPRFRCHECGRSFSSQTFRVDYRQRKPWLTNDLLEHFVSKVTLRQSARLLGVKLDTVRSRHRLIGEHCAAFHGVLVGRAQLSGNRFVLDELETYETDRRLQPLTVPTVVEARSFFVVHAEVAPLPCRGGLRPRDRQRKRQREERVGKRRSGSRRAVRACLGRLEELVRGRPLVRVVTDRKQDYQGLLRERFAGRLVHTRVSSKQPRNPHNPLFPVNLTFAMLRDGCSRLVRRTWAASKLAARLVDHLWIWIAWRNYVRGRTGKDAKRTPAMAAGVTGRRFTARGLLRWRAAFSELVLAH